MKDGELNKYSTSKSTIISIPYGLLKKKNTILVRMAGYPSANSYVPNNLFGFRVSTGYLLDYEKKLRKNHQQMTLLIFTAIYIFFGLYHLFFFIRLKNKKYNFYFAIFCISISSYFLAFSNLAYETFDDRRFLFIVAFIAQPVVVMSFILFLYDYFYSEKKFSKFIKYTLVSNFAFVIIFSIISIRFFLSILFLWYIFVFPQLLYIFSALKKGLKDSLPMAGSISIILLSVFWEILDTIFFLTGIRTVQYTFFTIISMIVILANRFIEINWETGRLNIELTRQRNSFYKFVPVQFLDHLGKNSASEISIGDCELKEMSVLFCDIRSFTALSESMSPEENFRFINSYLKRMSPAISRNKGFIDKFIGDAIMAIFPGPDNAVNASIQIMNELKLYNQHRINSGYAPIRVGVGVNTGLLMMGTVWR